MGMGQFDVLKEQMRQGIDGFGEGIKKLFD